MRRLNPPEQLVRLAPFIRVAGLATGFLAAIFLRVAIGGPNAAQSTTAGLVFAGCLVLLSLTAWPGFTLRRPVIISGIVGGAFLCFPALIFRLVTTSAHTPMGNYLSWAAVVVVVALAEELFLRGAFYDVVRSWLGDIVAIALCAVAFAVLHIPLYGWHVAPLDLAVGFWLGALRLYSGSWTSSGIAHALADLLSWLIR